MVSIIADALNIDEAISGAYWVSRLILRQLMVINALERLVIRSENFWCCPGFSLLTYL